MRTLSMLLLLAGSAVADAPKHPAPSAADQKKYSSSLRDGRALQAKHKYAEALVAFKACADLIPGDATALGELGWTAYLAKDLKLAESATRQALAGESAPNLRGASLYNLGLIEEANGKPAEAIAAYAESLKARPNGVVRAALAKLSPAAAKEFDPFKPVALAGPFASIEAYCKTTPAVLPDEEFDCSCAADDTTKITRTLAAPFLAVETIAHTCGAHASENGLTDYGIAVKTATGWYAGTLATVRQNRFCTDSMTLASVTAKDVAASAGSEVLLHFAIGGECMGGNGGQAWQEDGLVIVGGAKPSATPLIQAKRHETATDTPYSTEHGKTTADIALDFTWAADGTVVVKGKTTGLDKDAASNLLGKHTLAFP